MSYTQSIYIGIYFECERQYKIKKRIEQFCPSGCAILNGLKIRFCALCGKKIQEKNVDVKKEKNFTEEKIEELNESIIDLDAFGMDCHKNLIYILNDVNSDFCDWLEDNEIFEFNKIYYKTKVKEFKEKHPKIIDFLEKYHRNSYRIKYGIISYYS